MVEFRILINKYLKIKILNSCKIKFWISKRIKKRNKKFLKHFLQKIIQNRKNETKKFLKTIYKISNLKTCNSKTIEKYFYYLYLYIDKYGKMVLYIFNETSYFRYLWKYPSMKSKHEKMVPKENWK